MHIQETVWRVFVWWWCGTAVNQHMPCHNLIILPPTSYTNALQNFPSLLRLHTQEEYWIPKYPSIHQIWFAMPCHDHLYPSTHSHALPSSWWNKLVSWDVMYNTKHEHFVQTWHVSARVRACACACVWWNTSTTHTTALLIRFANGLGN
jgi:hypothetical protein